MTVVDLWWEWRGGGGLTRGPWPAPGGRLEQTLWTLSAFAILSDQYALDTQEK